MCGACGANALRRAAAGWLVMSRLFGLGARVAAAAAPRPDPATIGIGCSPRSRCLASGLAKAPATVGVTRGLRWQLPPARNPRSFGCAHSQAGHPGGAWIVLDNASTHAKPVLRAIINMTNAALGSNYRLVFLPAYSPELNPVSEAPRAPRAARLPPRTMCLLPPLLGLSQPLRRSPQLWASQIELFFSWVKGTVRGLGEAHNNQQLVTFVEAGASRPGGRCGTARDLGCGWVAGWLLSDSGRSLWPQRANWCPTAQSTAGSRSAGLFETSDERLVYVG